MTASEVSSLSKQWCTLMSLLRFPSLPTLLSHSVGAHATDAALCIQTGQKLHCEMQWGIVGPAMLKSIQKDRATSFLGGEPGTMRIQKGAGQIKLPSFSLLQTYTKVEFFPANLPGAQSAQGPCFNVCSAGANIAIRSILSP